MVPLLNQENPNPVLSAFVFEAFFDIAGTSVTVF